MPKREVIYTASDGKEFSSKAAAEQHEAIAAAKSDYETARNKLFLALSSKLKTKDGVDVDFGKRGTYYAVLFEYNNPTLVEVCLRWGKWDWEVDELDRLRIILLWRWPQDREGTFQRMHIDIGDLYAGRAAAIEAVLQAKQACIQQQQEDLDALKTEPSRLFVYQSLAW